MITTSHISINKPTSLSQVAALSSLQPDNYPAYMKEFLDALRRAKDDEVLKMIEEEPVLIGAVLDVHIAGMAEYIAFSRKIATPSWVEAPSRFLSDPVFFGGRHARNMMLATTSFSMRRRSLFCGEVVL